jgi:tetratricopeptide (TPR) repeat protein
LKKDPTSAALRVKIAEVLLGLGRAKEAAELLARARRIRPELADIHLMQALVAMERSRYAEAEEALGRAKQRAPEWAHIYWSEARLYRLWEKPHLQEEAYEKLLQLDPDDASAVMTYARFARLQQNPGKARALLEQLLRAVPWYGDAHVELAYLEVEAGDLKKADFHLAKALRINDDEPRIALLLWRLRLLRGDKPSALRLLDRLEVHGSAAYRVFAAKRYLALGLIDQASKQAEKAVEMMPGGGDPLMVLSEVALRRGDVFRAVSLATKAAAKGAEEGGDGEPGPDVLATIYARADRCAKGDRALEKLYRAHPRSIGFLAAWALLEAECRREGNAAELLRKKVVSGGMKPDEVYRLAYVLEAGGEWRQAVRLVKRLMVRDPDEVQALNFIGYTWAEQGVNIDASLVMLRRALRIAPLDPYLMDSLAVALSNTGSYERAADLLWKAHRLLPFDPDLLFHLGRVQEKRRKKRSAVRLYRRALRSKPLPRLRTKIESRLARLARLGGDHVESKGQTK